MAEKFHPCRLTTKFSSLSHLGEFHTSAEQKAMCPTYLAAVASFCDFFMRGSASLDGTGSIRRPDPACLGVALISMASAEAVAWEVLFSRDNDRLQVFPRMLSLASSIVTSCQVNMRSYFDRWKAPLMFIAVRNGVCYRSLTRQTDTRM